MAIKQRCSKRYGVKHLSPSAKKLESATAMSSFMVRKIRCQAHLLTGGPPTPLQPADWACSHCRCVIWCSSWGLSSLNPQMASKHFAVYLITIQIVPVLV